MPPPLLSLAFGSVSGNFEAASLVFYLSAGTSGVAGDSGPAGSDKWSDAMRHRFLLAAFGLTLLVPFRGSAAEPSGIEGTWIQILPDRPLVGLSVRRRPVTLVIAGSSFVEQDDGGAFRQSLFRLVPGRDPKAIDLTTVVADEFWLTHAIYKVEGDMLTICEGERDAPRPSAFHRWEAVGDDFTALMTFKRQPNVPPKDSR
jgi:uncharacterized protein (TIGR03067 family)